MNTQPPTRPFPDGYIARRRKNFLTLGLIYSAYYMCRYNFLSLANKRLTTEFGWRADEWGLIVNATLWAYAAGQIINGLRVDRVGGRKMILVGAVGIVAINLLLGFGVFVRTFTYFMTLGVLLGFFQSHGNPSLIKINGGWFRLHERGTFSGIFGVIIQVGRWAILVGGGYLVALAPWPWLFYAPAIVLALSTLYGYFNIAEHPESLGFPPAEDGDIGHGVEDATPLDLRSIISKVMHSKELWIISGAYFCTGVIRWGVDSWYIRYLQEVHGMNTDSFTYQITAFLIPISALTGSIAAGLLSDKVFNARRGPVATLYYLMSFVTLLLFIFFPGPILSIALLIIVQFFINGPHSILLGAAVVDFGGRKAAGFASGLVDSFQYLGGGLFAGSILGSVIQHYGNIPGSTDISAAGWNAWIIVIIGFSLLGALLMATMWNAHPMKRTPQD